LCLTYVAKDGSGLGDTGGNDVVKSGAQDR